MLIPFSEYPGRHERHYRRKIDNHLFPRPVETVNQDELLEMQRLDHEEIVEFIAELRQHVHKAVELQANEESQVILDLKADLEKLYETACRIGDPQDNNKAAIRDLLNVIMATVQAHAGDDLKAEQELMQEAMARQAHFALLEHPLVADLLDDTSLIGEDELAAVMLGEDEAQVTAALDLLIPEQRLLLAEEAMQLLKNNALENDLQMVRRVRLIRGDQ